MSQKVLFAFLLAALLALTHMTSVHAHAGHSHDDDEDEEENDLGEADVIVGTSSNFEALIKDNEFVLVEFYAPWCGHCKSLAPEYAKAATALKGENVKLVKIDATEENKLAERFNVKGYPTLKFFRSGTASEYNGGRTSSEIVSWLRKKTGPAAVSLKSQADVEAFSSKHEVAVVGFASGASKDAFFKVAAANDELAFAIVEDASVAASMNAKFPSVVVFKTFDEKRNDHHAAELEQAAVEAFVAASSTPLLMPFNDENVKKIFGSKIPHKALYFADYDSAGFADLEAAYRKLATEFKGKAVFATVNKDKEQVLEYFGLTEKDLPVFFVLKMSEDQDMKKYKHAGGVDTLGAFLNDYLAGNVKPHLKSEPVPAANSDEAVRTLVGLNFAEVALDESKDVLVEFYAPWCGHCKSLAPKYEKLAKKFAGISSVIIAKVDSTANDVEDVEISGFPTIKLFPAGGKKPVDYDGARTVKGLTKFLKEHATIPFELPTAGKEGHDEGKEDL